LVVSNVDENAVREGAQSGRREHSTPGGDIVERVVRREVGRLRTRGRRLLGLLDETLGRYPTAQSLVSDVEIVVRAHRRAARALLETDWDLELRGVAKQLERQYSARGDDSAMSLRWDREYGVFCIDVDGPLWRVRDDGACVDAMSGVEAIVEVSETTGEHGEGVTYPIIFTHEIENTHESVAQSIGWALLVGAVASKFDESGWADSVIIERASTTSVLQAGMESFLEYVPPATDFGFRGRGDLFRRLKDFDQTDPGAHWTRWMVRRQRAPTEVRVMREQGGARLRIEMRRPLRRLRIVEQPRSTVVRKRHQVFVDESSARARDRYFASETELERAAEEQLRSFIDDGFRIIYERLEDQDSVRERGRRSRGNRS